MKIDYAEALKKGLRFCIQPKRWLPFFIIDLSCLLIALYLVLANIPYFAYLLMGVTDMSLIAPALTFFAEIFLIFIVWLLAGLWITGALIHQSYREKEFSKSWRISGRKFLSILGVVFVTAVIAFFGGLVPYVGWVISIIIGFIFFFGMQGVIIKGDGFVKAIQDSWNIFKRQPFKVFLMWLVIAGISTLILILFALPLLAFLFNLIVDIASGSSVTTANFMTLALAIQNNLVPLVLSGIIFILGMGIARVFSIKAQTEFYEQIKKKHSGK